MSLELSQMILRIRATRASAVALFLLATISWGAIAEVAHHHGTLGASLSAKRNGLSTPNVESSGSPTSRNKSSSRDECLICQLHQNLSATALRHATYEAPATSQCLYSTSLTVVLELPFALSTRGRAPPANL